MSTPDRNVIPLPPNATRLEMAYAQSGTALLNQSIPIDALWDAWRCPAAFLPFLAYALSVDVWDDNWDEVKKRRTIAEAPEYHRRKGTRAAVEQAASYTGRDLTIAEWHEFRPPARRGTFRVTLHLNADENAAPASEMALLKRLVTAAKPKSRAFSLAAARVIALGTSVTVGLVSRSRVTLSVPPDALTLSISPIVSLRAASAVTLEAA